MGFSVVAASAIIGVSVLIALEIVVGTTFPNMSDIHNCYKEMKDRSIEQVQTDINITRVNVVINDTNWDVNISIENSGSISLKTSKFNILLNGTNQIYECDDTYLHPSDISYFIIPNYDAGSYIRIKAITENGISDFYDVTIGG
jgi:archaellum component FlaF (FlaF/FlaG flagellin family)